MKHFSLLISLLISLNLMAQNTVTLKGISMDSSHLIIEQGNLTVNGQLNANNGLILSQNSSIDKPGSIKFQNGEFLGYDGSQWISLSKPMQKEILGISTFTTDGSISTMVQGSSINGLAAANAICKSDYPDEPTAHFYHIDEIEKAVALGNLGALSPSNSNYWTMASVFRVSGTNYLQTNSIVNNCFNFLSNGGNQAEVGTTVRITNASPYAGQLLGYQVNLQHGTACNQQLRIVCGK